jgi:hypothetical protein
MDDDTKLLCRYGQLASRRAGRPICACDPRRHRLRSAPWRARDSRRARWWKWRPTKGRGSTLTPNEARSPRSSYGPAVSRRARRSMRGPRCRQVIVRPAGKWHGRTHWTGTSAFPESKGRERTRGRRCDSPAASGSTWRPDRPRQLSLADALRRIEREVRPPMRRPGRRGRPPQLLGKWPLAGRASSCASRPGDPTPDRGHASFRALLRYTRKKGADFSLPVPAVAAERPDRRELSCLCPSGYSLRINPEHRGDFRRG